MNDGKRKTGFGPTERKGSYDEYVGRYVIIFTHIPNRSFAGKLSKLEEEHAVLNPHQTGRYNSEGDFTSSMTDENSKVRIQDIIAIEPTTRESLEGYCVYSNRKQDKSDQESNA